MSGLLICMRIGNMSTILQSFLNLDGGTVYFVELETDVDWKEIKA